MADAKDLLQFLQRGVRLVADVDLKFGRIKLAPMAPTGLGCQCPRLDQRQIVIDRLAGDAEALCRLDFAAASVDKTHDPFPQIKAISFHPFSLPQSV